MQYPLDQAGKWLPREIIGELVWNSGIQEIPQKCDYPREDLGEIFWARKDMEMDSGELFAVSCPPSLGVVILMAPFQRQSMLQPKGFPQILYDENHEGFVILLNIFSDYTFFRRRIACYKAKNSESIISNKPYNAIH
jgi:hypothetical protein